MDYVNLGNTGLKVSRICLGCMTYGSPATGKPLPGRQPWALNEADSQPFLRQALDLGINFFDTANVYSGGDSEIVVGRFLKANTRREAIVLATKVHSVDARRAQRPRPFRKAILFELDQSLQRLADRLRRPLSDPSLGLRNAHRRNARSTSRCGQGRQGALHRRIVHVRLAVRQGALSRPTSTAGRASSPCRTTTTCSTAKKSAR